MCNPLIFHKITFQNLIVIIPKNAKGKDQGLLFISNGHRLRKIYNTILHPP